MLCTVTCVFPQGYLPCPPAPLTSARWPKARKQCHCEWRNLSLRYVTSSSFWKTYAQNIFRKNEPENFLVSGYGHSYEWNFQIMMASLKLPEIKFRFKFVRCSVDELLQHSVKSLPPNDTRGEREEKRRKITRQRKPGELLRNVDRPWQII